MWLDILTGTILIIALLKGYKNGFIRALISFFSLFIGLILAFQFAGWVASQLKEHTKIASHWLPFISFLIIFVLRPYFFYYTPSKLKYNFSNHSRAFAFAENNLYTQAIGNKKVTKIQYSLSRPHLKTKLKRRSINCQR